MTEQQYIGGVILILIVMVAVSMWYIWQRDLEAFRRDAQIGTHCSFYVLGNYSEGEIVACDHISVVIECEYGTHKRFRSDIYPV
jgi:hypothetical protein